jgi:hypothetical protein
LAQLSIEQYTISWPQMAYMEQIHNIQSDYFLPVPYHADELVSVLFWQCKASLTQPFPLEIVYVAHRLRPFAARIGEDNLSPPTVMVAMIARATEFTPPPKLRTSDIYPCLLCHPSGYTDSAAYPCIVHT